MPIRRNALIHLLIPTAHKRARTTDIHCIIYIYYILTQRYFFFIFKLNLSNRITPWRDMIFDEIRRVRPFLRCYYFINIPKSNFSSREFDYNILLYLLGYGGRQVPAVLNNNNFQLYITVYKMNEKVSSYPKNESMHT